MSLVIKNTRGYRYISFETGRGRSIHLGPADETNPDKFNTEHVKESIEYLLGAIEPRIETYIKLISLLPKKERSEYVSRLKEMLSKVNK